MLEGVPGDKLALAWADAFIDCKASFVRLIQVKLNILDGVRGLEQP